MVLTLQEKENLTDNVWAFRFKPSEPLGGTAGQFVQVELPHDNPDAEGTKRWFTNSTAPYEGILQITTRVTDSSFKQALSRLETGSTALQLIANPDGDFVWQDTDMPVVFIAGGIGVTPFRSILKERFHGGQPLNATLVYGGRAADLPFKDELEEWSAGNPELKVQYMVGTRLTAESLAGLVPELNQSLVYLSGPEPMVEALGDDVKKHGLPEAQLKQDFFPNYNEANY
jgi:ferredoxin-NADP reductase